TCKVTKKGGSTGTDNLISLGGFEFAPAQITDPKYKHAQNKMGDWINYEYLNFDQSGVNIAQGAVTTATNANNVKTAYFYNTQPHSGNYMLVADGGSSPNARVWSARDLKLKSGVTYQFSVWAANIDIEYNKHGISSLAKLKFVIENQDGTRELSSFTVKETLGQWNEFKATFTAAKDYGWCHIYLVNFNTEFEGNDFALDDIYFGAEIKTADDVTTETFPVVVKDCTAPPVEHNEKVCQDHTLTLTPTNTGTYLWDDGSTNPTLTISSTKAGTLTHYCDVTIAGQTSPVRETFNITVNPTLEESITATVKKGEPYTENGFNISGDQTSQGGILTFKLNTQSKVTGCDSIVTLRLQVKPDSPHHYETVCVDESITLKPSTTGISYKWSDGSTNPTLTITPTAEGTENYTCIVTTSNSGVGQNLIQNPDFEDVSTACPYPGFTTDFKCFNVDEDFPTSYQDARGWLRVAHKPFAATSITPHSGNYLLDIDGQDAGVTIVPFYIATLTGDFKKDETYQFTYWANTICVTDQAEITVKYTINGQTSVLIPKTTMTDGGWKQYGTGYVLTIPEDCSEITLIMVDEHQNWLSNDLALDDFDFHRINIPITTTEQFEIEVKTCKLDPIYHDEVTCQNTPITLTAETEGLSYEWSDGTQIVGNERNLTIDATSAGKFTYTCNIVKSKDGTLQRNIIKNGDFEDISTECPYPGIESDYDCYGVNTTMPTVNENGSFMINSGAWGSGPHGGQYCFLAKGSTKTPIPYALKIYTTEGLKKDKTYKLTFWATGASFTNTPVLRLSLLGNGPGRPIGSGDVTLNGDNDWHEYSFVITSTYDYTNNHIDFSDVVTAEDGNVFAIDDITLICTSVVPGLTQEEIFNLTVNPILYGTVKDRVCQGSEYNKDGFTVTAEETEAGGTITKTKTIPSLVTGCDSIVTLTLNVDPRLYEELEDQICSGKSYSKNGFTFTPEETAEAGTLTKTQTVKSMVTGCDSIVTLTLTVNPNPVFEIETKARTATIYVTAGTSPFKYVLDSKYTYDSDVIENLSIGDHTILVTDANTCASTGAFSIIPVPIEPMVYFTPNDDGINDIWNVKGLEYYPTAIVQIYDRYHKLLYSAKAIDFNGWDGTYNGHPMPMTDYWFVIINEELDKIMSGHFTLKR
ncbi:MAG: T9SS type B sorting domain-containing protein, partial [Paludibacteraceae bacterium]|nr:T9SS type B sorting domain-containing protein [Paludibacteraceae bacterium]